MTMPTAGRARVLIVEDDLSQALDTEDAVSSAGFAVIGVVKTMEAAAVLATDCDIALVDIGLGEGQSGTGIGKMLANQFGVSVVFLTATPQTVDKGFKGAFGVIAKPASAEDLTAVLDYARRRRAGEKTDPPQSFIAFA